MLLSITEGYWQCLACQAGGAGKTALVVKVIGRCPADRPPSADLKPIKGARQAVQSMTVRPGAPNDRGIARRQELGQVAAFRWFEPEAEDSPCDLVYPLHHLRQFLGLYLGDSLVDKIDGEGAYPADLDP